MVERRLADRVREKRAQRRRGRSARAWLRAKWDEVVELRAGDPPTTWAEIADLMAEDGVTYRNGDAPNEKLARQTFNLLKGKSVPRRSPVVLPAMPAAAPLPSASPVAEPVRRMFRPAGGDKDWSQEE